MPIIHSSPSRMRAARWAALAWCAVACQQPKPVRVGDAIPRPRTGLTFDNLVQDVFDSFPTGRRVFVERWTVDPGLEVVRAMEAAERFAAIPELIGVVGHSGSRDALLAAAVYNARGVPQLVPNATSRRLAEAGPWTFPLVPSDSVEGAFLGEYALDTLHAARVSVFYVGDEYGIGLRDGVSASMRLHDRELVDQTMLPNQGCGGPAAYEIQRFPVVASLRRAHPDVVILATGASSAACLIGIIQRESPGTWILGGDGIATDFGGADTLNVAARSRVRSVVFWVPGDDSANVAFLERYRRQLHREPTAAQALAYDGMMLLAAAAREGGTSREAVRRWIQSLGRTRPPFHGVTGPVSFNHGRVGARLLMMPPQEGSH